MDNLILSKKDITQEIISYLKTQNIHFWGNPPELFTDCIFCKEKHTGSIFTDNGLVVCEVCKRVWSFETFQLKVNGRVIIFLEEQRNPEKRIGIFNSISKDYTQTEIEKCVFNAHANLKRNSGQLKWLISNAEIFEKTIDAFRIGWTGDFMSHNIFRNYLHHFVLPVVSQQGAYLGLRFLSDSMVLNSQTKIIPGWGGNTTFWGNKPKRIYAFGVIDNPIKCMKISQWLAFNGPEDICIISPSAGSRGIPTEWTHREFFGRKIILFTSSDHKFANIFSKLMKKSKRQQKNKSQLSSQNSEIIHLSKIFSNLYAKTYIFLPTK